MIHHRNLMLKTNGDDQNSKRHKIYGTKLKHFIVRGPNWKPKIRWCIKPKVYYLVYDLK